MSGAWALVVAAIRDLSHIEAARLAKCAELRLELEETKNI